MLASLWRWIQQRYLTFCIVETKPKAPEGHGTQSDASRHNDKFRKLNTHDKQYDCQRAPNSVYSEARLNESFYVEIEPYDDLPGDDEDPVVGFKKTCEGMYLGVLLI